MGFYSFYRIIKDILRGFFGNKAFRIIAIFGILFLFFSLYNKVNGAYVGDTNGFFDNTTFLEENQTTFNINNISCTIPLSYYNYSTILIKPYFANGSITRIYSYYTNGDLKYDFSNNKFYSTDTLYRGQCNVSSNIANFNNITPTEYTGSSGVNALYVAGDTYNSFLLGSIYDNSNNNLIVSSVSSSSGSSFEVSDPEYTFTLDTKFDDYTYRYLIYNPDFEYTSLNQTYHAMTFYFVASKSPIKLRQEYVNNELWSYIVTDNNDQFYFYGMNMPVSYTVLFNLQNFNTWVNSSATLRNSNSTGFVFEDTGVQTNEQFYNNIRLYADSTIYFTNGKIAFTDSNFFYPFLLPPSSDIEQLNFDDIFVELGDWEIEDNPLYVKVLKITRYIAENNSIAYYYNDKTITLSEGNKYYKTLADSDKHYFSIPKSTLGLDTNSSYLLVLSSSGSQISGSSGILTVNENEGIFQVVEIDTSGLITQSEVDHNIFLQNEQHLQDIANGVEKTEETINNTFNNTTVTNETQTEIDSNLNFNNNNSTLTNLNGGFFSRLSTMLSNIVGYNLNDDTTINIPLPNSNQNLVLHSNFLYNNLNTTMKNLISAFWLYIFGFYMWRFINKLYIAISTGNILDTFSSSGEAITNNML